MKYLSICFVLIFSQAFAQETVSLPINKPGVALLPDDSFQYTTFNYSVGNYSLGFYEDPWLVGAATAYLSGAAGIKLFTASQPRLSIDLNGNVGIGTTNFGGSKLAVAGSIISTSLSIKALANWPDYVFDRNYHLRSLKSISSFISTHHHLPGLLDKKEVLSNGFKVEEIQAKLLEKIEELTLHAIAQEKKIDQLQKRLINLEQKKAPIKVVKR